MIGAAILGQLAELARVARALPDVEQGRKTLGPKPLVARLRAQGERAPSRDAEELRRLQRAIRWVDALYPGKRSCYRRALLEIALDRDRAKAVLVMGFRACGDVSGHAWLEGSEEPRETYGVRIEL